MLEDLPVGARQVARRCLGLGVGREDHRVAGLEREHGVAHRRHDWIGDWAHGGDHSHRLRDHYEVLVLVLADDAARLLALEAVPDDPRLASRFRDLVLVHAEAGLLVRG